MTLWLPPLDAAVKPPPRLPVRTEQVKFPMQSVTLLHYSPKCSCYDAHQHTAVIQQQQRQPSLQLAMTVLWALWLKSLVHLDLPCLPTEVPTRKIKVLFAFTCAGSRSEAECQAAESGTAARPCAEKTVINEMFIGADTSRLKCLQFSFFAVIELVALGDAEGNTDETEMKSIWISWEVLINCNLVRDVF